MSHLTGLVVKGVHGVFPVLSAVLYVRRLPGVRVLAVEVLATECLLWGEKCYFPKLVC